MDDRNQLARGFFTFLACTGIAILLGYQLATPLYLKSLALVGLTLGLLCLPILMKHHRLFLLLSFNSALVVFFLPGALPLWVMTSFISLGFSILERATAGRKSYQHVASIAIPLILMTIIILVTSKISGGIGFRAMGGNSAGGKKYLFLFSAVAAYFAFACFRPPPQQAKRMLILYFAVGILSVCTHIIYALGPPFYFLFNFFPPEMASLAELEFGGPGSTGMVRYGGLSSAGVALCMMMQLTFGIRGLLDFNKPWRISFYVLFAVLSLFGGFRSLLAFLILAFTIQFIFEGLTKTRYTFGIIAAAVFTMVLVLPFSRALPLSFQRAISLIPFADVDPAIRMNAEHSTNWRISMWKVVLPEAREHLWRGKGYAINPMDLHLASESVRRGYMEQFEPAMIAGEYHSGPLSVSIPFGLPGAACLIWLWWGTWIYLYRCRKYGDPRLRSLNTFLISYLTAKAIFFVFAYGSFSSDLQVFTGLAGMAVAMNGADICAWEKKEEDEERKLRESTTPATQEAQLVST